MVSKIISGRYEIRTRVGSGGMAVVYKAIDQRTRGTVALKILRREYSNDKEYIRRFTHEAEAASKMYHENIVNTLDYGEDGDNRYIVMEYVEGETLKSLINRKGKLSAKTVVPMIIRILAAVDYAHNNKIIHRDIKPQNILVDKHGTVKVADFGIARSLRKPSGNTGNTEVALGSVHYFSPEQATGTPADEKSDLYSVGVVLYEMLTGELPFDGETAMEIAYKHLNNEPRSMRSIDPNISKALDEVVMRALSKDAFKRYQKAADMAADIKKAVRRPRGGFVRYPETAVEKKARQKAERKRMIRVWIAAGVAVIVLCVLGVNLFIRNRNVRMQQYTAMPPVIGLEADSAEQQIVDAGLQYTVEYLYSNDHPEGTVVEQSVASGEWIERNSTVRLKICAGSSSILVPDVIGRTEAEAKELLEEQGLTKISISYVPDETRIGEVTYEEPNNTEVARGTTIRLTVATKPCTVPLVTGMSREAAELAIAAAGLKVGTVTEMLDADNASGTVLTQSLEAKTIVAQNTTIDLTVVQYVEPVYYVQPMIEVNVTEDDSTILLAVQKPSGETFEVSMDALEKGTHQFSLTSDEHGSHVVDIYVNGTWIGQVSRQFQ